MAFAKKNRLADARGNEIKKKMRKIFKTFLFFVVFVICFLFISENAIAQRGITTGSTWHFQTRNDDCSELKSSCAVYGGVPVPIQVNYCDDFGGGVYKWVRVQSCACNNACYGCPRGGWMPPEFSCAVPACSSGWTGNVSPCGNTSTPSVVTAGCYQSCFKDSDCSAGLKCGYQLSAGKRVCLNSLCAYEKDCRCSWQ